MFERVEQTRSCGKNPFLDRERSRVFGLDISSLEIFRAIRDEALFDFSEPLNEDLQTALHIAAKTGNIELVRWLARAGRSNLDSRDRWGATALHYAIEAKHNEIAKLLARIQDPNARDRWNQTPLHWAVSSDNEEMVHFLVEECAVERNQQDQFGRTPLHIVVEIGQSALVEWLLAHHFNPNVRDNEKKTPAHIATVNNDLKTLKILAQYGALLEEPDQHRQMPIHYASELNYVEILTWLLEEQGVMIDLVDQWGQSPILLAAMFGKLEALQLLYQKLKETWSIDYLDAYMRKALFLACKHNHIRVVRWCKEIGISLCSKNRYEQKPIPRFKKKNTPSSCSERKILRVCHLAHSTRCRSAGKRQRSKYSL